MPLRTPLTCHLKTPQVGRPVLHKYKWLAPAFLKAMCFRDADKVSVAHVGEAKRPMTMPPPGMPPSRMVPLGLPPQGLPPAKERLPPPRLGGSVASQIRLLAQLDEEDALLDEEDALLATAQLQQRHRQAVLLATAQLQQRHRQAVAQRPARLMDNTMGPLLRMGRRLAPRLRNVGRRTPVRRLSFGLAVLRCSGEFLPRHLPVLRT